MAKIYLSTDEAAEKLGVSRWTLIAWRRRMRGPRYVKLGSKVCYKQPDIDDFLASSTVTPSVESVG